MDLQGLQDIAQAERERQKPTRIHCCTSTGCRAAEAMDVYGNLKQAVKDHNLDDQMEVIGVGCMGFLWPGTAGPD